MLPHKWFHRLPHKWFHSAIQHHTVHIENIGIINACFVTFTSKYLQCLEQILYECNYCRENSRAVYRVIGHYASPVWQPGEIINLFQLDLRLEREGKKKATSQQEGLVSTVCLQPKVHHGLSDIYRLCSHCYKHIINTVIVFIKTITNTNTKTNLPSHWKQQQM